MVTEIINTLLHTQERFRNKLRKAKVVFHHFDFGSLPAILKIICAPKIYQAWHNKFDKLTSETIEQKRNELKKFSFLPKISIVVPVYNTDEKLLERMFQSVLSQIYSNWELCVTDDASTEPAVHGILKKYAAHPQIKIVYRKENAGISQASNDALQMADGEYITFLDHDDELRPHALFEVVKVLQNKREAKLLYSNEDRIDINGRLLSASYKPAFNPELLRSKNYFCHLTVIKADEVRKVGAFSPEADAAQDWDLFLKIVEKIKPTEIIYLPKILYHWRKLKTSVSNSAKQDEILNVQRTVIEKHIARLQLNAEVNIDKDLGRPAVSYQSLENFTYDVIQINSPSDLSDIKFKDIREDFILFIRKGTLLKDDLQKKCSGIFQQRDVAAVCATDVLKFSAAERNLILSDYTSVDSLIFASYDDYEQFYLRQDFHPSLFYFCPILLCRTEMLSALNCFDLDAGIFFDIDLLLRLKQAGYRIVSDPTINIKSLYRVDKPKDAASLEESIEYMNNKWGAQLFEDKIPR